MLTKLKFEKRSLIWLYIPIVKDTKEKEEDSGLRPYLLTNTENGLYEFSTMTEHFKKIEHQYIIKYEKNALYQSKPVNYNTKVFIKESVLKRILGKVYHYLFPYQLNKKDFAEFKMQQDKYFSDPALLGKRYEINVV